MGRDACISFTTVGNKMPVFSEHSSGWATSPTLPEIVKTERENDGKLVFDVRNPYRYYHTDYPRGNWPMLCSILMILKGDARIEKVFYGCDEIGMDEFSIKDILDLSAFYVESRGEGV